MRLVTPNYKARSPIVNDTHFSDTALPMPTVGGRTATFNPGGKSGQLPNGPPKYIQVPGKRPYAKGLTNRRLTQNI